MFNSAKTIAEQKERISTLEAELATAHTARDAAEARVTEFEAKLKDATATHEKAFADLKADHEAALKQKDADAEARVQREVTDALASAGVPESKLPSQKPRGEGPGSASTYAEAIEHYNSLSDPKEAAAYWASTVTKFIGV